MNKESKDIAMKNRMPVCGFVLTKHATPFMRR